MSALAVLALASCSSDSLVGESPVSNEAPIEFTVGQKNITRGSNKLEDNGYSNFGVWAYKYTADEKPTSALVMKNYEVGCAGYGSYSKDITKGTWYYEGLGTNQVLRYWDLSYNNTKFFAYAPYNDEVTFEESTKKMTVPASANVASNTNDFVYANTTRTNADHEKVPLAFKHIGAKVNLKFYEDVAGYKVQLIDVTTDGTGIQLTPATKSGDTYTKSDYYTAYDAVIDFSKSPVAVDAVDLTAATTKKTQDNLVFAAPTGDVPAAVSTGNQTYLASETTYYAVAQPSTSETGFTLHVSFKLIAEDNSEKIIVRDARVYIPAKDGETRIALWESNKAYTYTFKITKDTNGSTSATEPDITKPTVPTDKGLYPIVFDNITIEDYTAVGREF